MNDKSNKDWDEFIKSVIPLEKNIVSDRKNLSQKLKKEKILYNQDESNLELIEIVNHEFLLTFHEIDRNLLKKLKKTKISEKNKLDLHGLRFKEAKRHVQRFIETSFFSENRLLLIITGKGKRSSIEEGWKGKGVLKEHLPKWLASDLLSKYILWFGQATSQNGGSGALLVYLKKL